MVEPSLTYLYISLVIHNDKKFHIFVTLTIYFDSARQNLSYIAKFEFLPKGLFTYIAPGHGVKLGGYIVRRGAC